MIEYTKVRVSLSLEILEGDDRGYYLEEQNKILMLKRNAKDGVIVPYSLTLDFITPNILRDLRTFKDVDEEGE